MFLHKETKAVSVGHKESAISSVDGREIPHTSLYVLWKVHPDIFCRPPQHLDSLIPTLASGGAFLHHIGDVGAFL